ncbi:uncharacterized protein LOC121981386 isoform X1 [Zingiber officinale]|uniref:uncharacterized protein LOC121981386 isoform X1 n=1 Tax=Zingiber officinale TaxID=94328 RepID=UPI001C4D59BB|nr:uncharacterized protein LOC121981386 isoform X1 [Zingiber officinale]
MGKPEEVRVEVPDLGSDAAAAASGWRGTAWICRALSARCLLVLVLSAAVLLSAVFWLPLFRAHRSGFVSDDSGSVHAEIQASFILQKPISALVTAAARLEYEIFEEIGIPNTKVSIISMHPLTPENSTYVTFGFLPEPKNASINSAALSILRSTLIDLVLKQINITWTSSFFGDPSSFELLKFPGGITVVPSQSASIWEIAQTLFDFKLNNSIEEILKNMDSLKAELKFGLNLTSNENAYVKLMNSDGSTVESPVTIEASVLSDIGSGNLLPDRMRQLAQFITGPDSNNLGLNNSVFGKVKQVQLSSYLENSISSLPPSPSPSPSDGIVSAEPPSLISISSPAPASAPALLNNHYGQPPCFYSHTLPSHSPGAYPPAPNVGIKSHQPQFHAVNVPVPSPSTEPPNFPPIYSEHSPNLAAPSSHEVMKPNPKVAREPSLAPVSHASSSIPGSGGGEGLLAAPLSSFISLSSGSKIADQIIWETNLAGLLGFLIVQFVCGTPY